MTNFKEKSNFEMALGISSSGEIKTTPLFYFEEIWIKLLSAQLDDPDK